MAFADATRSDLTDEGPVDYGFTLACAEEAARAEINRILEDGATILSDHRAAKQAYPFATEMAIEALSSSLKLCFVPHTAADPPEDWEVGSEPEPRLADSWASMHVQVVHKASTPPPPTSSQLAIGVSKQVTGWERQRAGQDVLKRQMSHGVDFRRQTSYGVDFKRQISFDAVVDSESARLLAVPPIRETDFAPPTVQSLSRVSRRTSRSGSASSSQTSGDRTRVGATSSIKSVNSRAGDTQRRRDTACVDARAWSLTDTFVENHEEDRLRAAKLRRDAKRQAQAEAQRLEQIEEELEKERQKKRFAEMAQMKPATFDSYGKLIWIREPQVDMLPDFQEHFEYDIGSKLRKELNGDDPSGMLQAAHFEVPLSPQERPSIAPHPGRNRRTPKRSPKEAFTDFFFKPEMTQPPLDEIFTCKPGVILQCNGKTVRGEPNDTGKMTRAEYLELCHQTGCSSERTSVPIAAVTCSPSSPTQAASTSQAVKMEQQEEHATVLEPHFPQHCSTPDVTATPEPQACKDGQSPGAVRVVRMLQRPGSAIPTLNRHGQDCYDENTKAPPAPPWAVRAKKEQAIGHPARQPRDRVPSLGAPTTRPQTSWVQPVIGATMGHGLICEGKRKESYYFPPSSPAGSHAAPPIGYLTSGGLGGRGTGRTSSEASLRRGVQLVSQPASAGGVRMRPSSASLLQGRRR